MAKKEILLAKSFADFAERIDPTGWWLSEKLDGIRALWDGKCFRSRGGNTFAAPAWFVERLPQVPLDGELWVGRGAFDQTSSIVRSSADKGWVKVRYMVFDIPLNTAEAGPFEQRQAMLAELAKAWGDYARVVRQIECRGRAHLEEIVDAIVADGGEGAMLRQPRSMYEFRRSSTLLKVKRFHDDEATVTGYQPGKGKHLGVMGAIQCTTDDGVAFEIGTGFSDAERASPPAIGSRVTFRFQELTKDGVPRFPSFVRIRHPE